MQQSKSRTILLTLDDAQKQFQLWRANKTSGSKIPEPLWELVAKLFASKNYKRTIIGETLGISTYQLRNKFPEYYPSKPMLAAVVPKKHKPFVQAPLDTLLGSPLLSSTAPQLTIERNNGTKFILSSVTEAQFSLLLKAFME